MKNKIIRILLSVLFVIIFVMTYGKNVKLEDDLLVNYTGEVEDK